MAETEYQNKSDEELLELLKNGDQNVMDYICDKYKNLVRKEAQSMYILGADNEDLIQEGMIGLFKAVRDYDSGRDASFFTFAKLCISRQIYTAVQASNRKKHIPLNNYISIYASGDSQEQNQDGEKAFKELSVLKEQSPEQMVLDKERVEYLEKRIEEELSPFEKQVLDLYITKMPTSEIARVLNREEKATDNALQRLKAKIRKIV